MKGPEFLSPKFAYVKSASSYSEAHDLLLDRGIQEALEFFIECSEYRTWMIKEGGSELMDLLFNSFTALWHQKLLSDRNASKVVSVAHSIYAILKEHMVMDLRFEVGEECFEANSLLVGAQSKLMRDWLLKQHWEEGKILTMRVEELPPKLFKHVNEFIVKGTCEDLWREDPDAIMEVIFFANQHGMDALAQKAAGIYGRYLSDENVEKMLKFAQQEYLSALEEACCAFINQRNFGLKLTLREGLGLEVTVSHYTDEAKPLLEHLSRQLAYLHLEGLAAEEAETVVLLQKIRRLVGLNLQGSYGISEEVLVALPSISELNLAECSWLTDDALKKIAARAPRLASLNLRRCESISYEGLSALQKLTRLTRLDLSECGQLGDEDLDLAFSGCPILTEINLSYLNFGDRGLEALGRSCQEVTHLNLSYCRGFSSPALLELASHLPRLQEIILDGCLQIESEHLIQSVRLLPHLSRLSVRGLRLLPDALQEIAHLKSL